MLATADIMRMWWEARSVVAWERWEVVPHPAFLEAFCDCDVLSFGARLGSGGSMLVARSARTQQEVINSL
jgi:hypothetical protein